MGLKLVIERECSRDHQMALRQFLCCEPGGPEWAMDPQERGNYFGSTLAFF